MHVVLLELLIDPTCSVLLEREPLEPEAMTKPPRNLTEPLVASRMWWRIILQGLMIFAGSFGIYHYLLTTTANAPLARAAGFGVIVLSSLFLAQLTTIGSSSIAQGLKILRRDKVSLAIYAVMVLVLAMLLFTPVGQLFYLAPLNFIQAILVIAIALATTFWVRLIPKPLS